MMKRANKFQEGIGSKRDMRLQAAGQLVVFTLASMSAYLHQDLIRYAFADEIVMPLSALSRLIDWLGEGT